MTQKSTIRVASLGRDRAPVKHWLEAKHVAHAGDDAFVAPLAYLEKRRLVPKHNPFFEMGDAEFFVAYRGGRPVGRISAQSHHAGVTGVSPDTGHFGFFDVADDDEAATALLDAASAWLRDRGASIMRGPFNLSINEECGCQIDGFDIPSSYLMPQARPWTGTFLADWGLTKSIDMQAWRLTAEAALSAMDARKDAFALVTKTQARPIRMNRFKEEVALLADIYNDAWSDNWGFVPFSPRAIELLAAELRMIYRSSYGYFVEVADRPVGMLISVPNLNELIKPFRGRLTPVNAMKLAWALFREQASTVRIPIAGVRKSHRGGLEGVTILGALIEPVIREARRKPKQWFEFSWVLETNRPAIAALRQLGAGPVSTYRIYERAL